MSAHRFPHWVFDAGNEPDVRFTLANERTVLAWNRTALALIAGGVAMEALGLDLQPMLRLSASLLLVIAGLIVPLAAFADWARSERALRLDLPLPGAVSGIALTLVVTASGVLIFLGILLR